MIVAFLFKKDEKKSSLLSRITFTSDCRRNVFHEPLVVGLGDFSNDFLSDLVIPVVLVDDGILLAENFCDTVYRH